MVMAGMIGGDDVLVGLRRERVETTAAILMLRRDLEDDPRLLPLEAQIARGEERLRKIEEEIDELENGYH